MVDTIFPLWVMTTPTQGGFNMGLRDIGIIMGAIGPLQIVSQIFIYPILVRRLGCLLIFRFGCALLSFFSVAMPWISITSSLHPAVSWCLLIGCYGLIAATRVAILTSLFVLINNSVFAPQRGTVNGIGQSMAAAGRFLGPTIGATVFAYSQGTAMRWPLNYHLTFILMASTFLLSAAMSCVLPESLNRAKVSSDQQGGNAVQKGTKCDVQGAPYASVLSDSDFRSCPEKQDRNGSDTYSSVPACAESQGVVGISACR